MTGITDWRLKLKEFEEIRDRVQRKIGRHSGELVVAVSRDYQEQRFTSHGPVDGYFIRTRLEAGVISEATVLQI